MCGRDRHIAGAGVEPDAYRRTRGELGWGQNGRNCGGRNRLRRSDRLGCRSGSDSWACGHSGRRGRGCRIANGARNRAGSLGGLNFDLVRACSRKQIQNAPAQEQKANPLARREPFLSGFESLWCDGGSPRATDVRCRRKQTWRRPGPREILSAEGETDLIRSRRSMR